MNTIQRGEVYEVKPDPSVGKEIQKSRPCVVVSSNVLNIESNLAVVCPATDAAGKTADVIHVLAKSGDGGLTKDSIILCDQVKAVDQLRLTGKLGNLPAETMKKIDRGLRAVLNLT
ncbi:MAG: type II toxin-antitoxin system PemK/MazF family toxin [Bacteroidota bacterium]